MSWRNIEKNAYNILNLLSETETVMVFDVETVGLAEDAKIIEYYQSFGEYPTGINPSVKDKLVTLSTCALQGSRRFVVQGYLVETITLD